MSIAHVSDEPERLAGAPDPRDVDRRVFDLQLERVRLQVMRAVERGRQAPAPATLEGLEAALVPITAHLASARREGGSALREQVLKERLGLSDLELDFVWTVVALTMDPHLWPHAVLLGGSDARQGASPALHASLAALDGRAARDLALALGPSHALLRYGLLTLADPSVVPAARPFSAPPRLAGWLAGRDSLDETVAAAGGLATPPGAFEVDAAQAAILTRATEVLASEEPVVLVVEGPAHSGRTLAVAEAARRAGRIVVGLDVSRLPATLPALESALLALGRECLLQGAVLLVSGLESWAGAAPDHPARLRAIARALDDAPYHAALVTGDPSLDLPLGRRRFRSSWRLPDTETRRRLWRRALGPDAAALDDAVADLALRYRLGATGIAHAVTLARFLARSRPERALLAEDLVTGVRNDIAERMEGLAQPVDVVQGWEDLVLPADVIDQITALMTRVTHAYQVLEGWGFRRKLPRGQGVAALFSGAPGTGKTMVAGLIARELGLELYQVDLSRVVSKWVGETEKQLARIFDAAEAGHALLLFDEADALFARRTEVKSAVDRYANLEVNYLLQRIESFGGVTILTTNLDTSIDPALRRRLAAHVVFWPPDEPERAELWGRMLPAEAPVARPIDLVALARAYPEMTGANIRNAVLAAAFLAAEEGSSITEKHLVRAAKGEYRAMGRLTD
ncbi:MAG TPA: AAA family ATPase [Polyangia bacterium]|nr:AAA family ATPase [Polyangia bacterium]